VATRWPGGKAMKTIFGHMIRNVNIYFFFCVGLHGVSSAVV
jgi:hypothetical protein